MSGPNMLRIPLRWNVSNEDDLARLQRIIEKRRTDGWKPKEGWLTSEPQPRITPRKVTLRAVGGKGMTRTDGDDGVNP